MIGVRQFALLGVLINQSHALIEKDRSFKYLSSHDIHLRVQELARTYPHFVTLVTAQDAFGLPAAGTADDCPFDSDIDGCRNWILTIEDLTAHDYGFVHGETVSSEPLQSWKELPEVLLSGCLHGNERIGPTAVMETVSLLLEAAACEASMQPASLLYNADPASHLQCKEILRQNWGIQDDSTRRWLARLVSTRRIIVVPTANALGYFRNKREEDRIDPNRDFPYDLEDYSQCMQTVAARALNEVFRQHMIQLSFTFHAGMEAIGYEWGAPTYQGQTSPDDIAQNALAARYAWYGGEFPKRDGNLYPFGDMNGLVYPVRGGMEDWAYAASWDPSRTQPCTPSTFGGYEASKTTYNDSTLRTFNMLVETSNKKTPDTDALGSATIDLLNPQNTQDANGHISRNLRLSLLLIDMVQPYTAFTAVHGQELMSDIISATQIYKKASTCIANGTKIEIGSSTDKGVTVEWTVGGAFDVDETFILYGKLNEMQHLFDGGCNVVPPSSELMAALDNSQLMKTEVITSGRTRWHEHGPSPIDQVGASGEMPQNPVFRTQLAIHESDTWVAVAVARVDSSWADKPPGVELGPQSHVVNARTNTSWYHESASKVIRGRTHWISLPIMLDFSAKVEKDITTSSTQALDYQAEAKLDHPKKEQENQIVKPESKTANDEPIDGPPLSILQTLVAMVAIFGITGLIASRIWTRRTRPRPPRRKYRKPTRELETVALSANGDDDTEIDITEFESENPFADPENAGQFVQYRDDPRAKVLSV